MSQNPRHSGILYTPADGHPPSTSAPPVPRWTHPRRSRPSSVASHPKPKRTVIENAKRRVVKLQRWAKKRVRKLTLQQKILGSLLVLFVSVSAILMLVFHSQILHAMLPIASKLRQMRAGWLLIFTMCFISAFPPMIGYSTSVTLAGFIYGFPNGWFIVAAATILGATTAFIACRQFFQKFSKRMVATDKRFAALSLTLKHDGIKLLCMIRLCPLPYSIGNGAMSTFPTVTPWAFMLATACATPKLMIHVFIGERLARLAEADQKMDTKTKVLNYTSIIGGILLGVLTGWLIYKRTIKRANQLEAEERARIRGTMASPSGRTPSSAQFTDDESLDPHAATAAGLVAGLVEGDELEQAGIFSDVSSSEDDGESDDLLGSSEEETGDTGYGMEDSVELERSGGEGRGAIALP
ncbi:hypothetical protein DFP73DRAFT_493578 [Morchella snyderi]|nr:hypothetical protein DFP73DRAFT_493578 [Morchella snyderi]